MSPAEWIVFWILLALALWGLIKVAKESSCKENEHPEDRKEDDAALDSIRGELEQQEAPYRPHIRSVK